MKKNRFYLISVVKITVSVELFEKMLGTVIVILISQASPSF